MNILSYLFFFFVLCSIKISFNNLFIVSFFFYKNQRREIKSYHQKFLFLIFLSLGTLGKIYKFVLFSHSFFSFFYNWRFPLDVYYIFDICNRHRTYSDFFSWLKNEIIWRSMPKFISKRMPKSMIMRTSIDHLHRSLSKFQEAIRLLFGCSFFYFFSRRFFFIFHCAKRHTI
jgi:hypothetical protein